MLIALILVTGWIIASVVFAFPLCLFLKACAFGEADEDAAHDQSDRLKAINATNTHGEGV